MEAQENPLEKKCRAGLWTTPEITTIRLGSYSITICESYKKSVEKTGFEPSPEYCSDCEHNPQNSQKKADEIARALMAGKR